MKRIVFPIVIVFSAIAANSQTEIAGVTKIEASPEKGFAYPYYLFVPTTLRGDAQPTRPHTILVSPNNTGSINDDMVVHEANVKRRIAQAGFVFGRLNMPVLMPVFPRPKTDWKIYTHALDRDSMLTEKKEYARFDLQLASMIDDARERLASDKITTDTKVFIYGFSAAGMFANRFTFLHPKRVKAAAIGSPGGWPIAPATKFAGKELRYPIGVNDLKAVAGSNLKLNDLRKVRFFIFLGDKDVNDSLVFSDGYEEQDKELVFELFGKTPVERWDISKKLYLDAKLNAEFKLYPDTEHRMTPAIIGDITAFFERSLK
jgi:dienelactone hydrolase